MFLKAILPILVADDQPLTKIGKHMTVNPLQPAANDGHNSEEPLGVSVARTAKLIGVSRPTIYKDIKDGALESVMIGRRRIITMASIRRRLGLSHNQHA